ncbi:hypothetical protein ACFX5U_09425 [Sphingobacterium sp. SG20118]|uniref:hypothetical protein n=1 Tax=unclassified Sphingobacterium TaxID=2609468 RepID=UPI0004F84B1D|nr:hypothetical protein [Sphingobacterium sp. ML3W]AIM37107.1 hypothetical protein KO02_10695 [Sphingobacterium sp. ML3W]
MNDNIERELLNEGNNNIYETLAYVGEIDSVQTIKFLTELNNFAFQRFICRNINFPQMKYELLTRFHVAIFDRNRNRNLGLLSCAYKFIYQEDDQFHFDIIKVYSLEEFEQRYKEYQHKE